MIDRFCVEMSLDVLLTFTCYPLCPVKGIPKVRNREERRIWIEFMSPLHGFVLVAAYQRAPWKKVLCISQLEGLLLNLHAGWSDRAAVLWRH